MADVAIDLTTITQLAGLTEISLQPTTANILAADRIVVPGRFEQDAVIDFVPSASGTPITNLSLLSASFFVDTAASAVNPIQINAKGVDLDIAIPASIMSLVTVSDAGVGSGLPSGQSAGTGAINFTAVSPNWEPQNEITAGENYFFDITGKTGFPINDASDTVYLDGTVTVEGNVIGLNNNADIFIRNVSDDSVKGFNLDNCTYMAAIVTRVAETGILFGADGSSGDAGSTWLGDSTTSYAYAGVSTNTSINYDGFLSGSDPLFVTASSTTDGGVPYQGGTGGIPADTPIFVIYRIDTELSRAIDRIGARRSNGGRGIANIHWLGFIQEALTTDKLLRLQSWMYWRLADLGIANNPGLPVGHPYENRPLSAAGGVDPGISLSLPVVSYARTVSNAPTGAAIAIFKRDGSLLADRSQFTLAAGNDSGDGELVIAETIPNDTPDSGFIRIARDDGSEDRLAYSSWAGSTFTLSGTLPATYSSGNGAYVGYLDVLGSSTGTETVNLQYVSNRDCVLVVALGSGGGRIRPIRQNITLGASDFEFQVSAIADAINTST